MREALEALGSLGGKALAEDYDDARMVKATLAAGA
jgi:hypothetical protein